MKVYVDSNIFLNYIFDEYRGSVGFFSNRAENFFRRTFQCEFDIVVSGLVIDEILGAAKTSRENIDKIFDRFKLREKLEIVEPLDSDAVQAENLIQDKTHFSDALHAVMAKRTGCRFIVTRNKKHFTFSGISPRLPEEL